MTKMLSNTTVCVLFFLLFTVFAINLRLLIPESGWPANHEWTVPFQGVEAYRRAISQGDLLPTWAPYSQYGFGSPFPLFYHKLFFYIGGLVALLTGYYLALKITIMLFLWVGSTGMYFFLKKSQFSTLLSVVGAFLFLISPYTFTNWLIRGSMADFSAVMLVPWLFWVFANFLNREKKWINLAVVLTFIIHGHKILGFYALLFTVVFISFLLFTKKFTFQDLLKDKKQIILASLLLFVFVAPQIIVDFLMMPHFSMSVLEQNQFYPPNNYRELYLYFAHNHFTWGKKFDGYSVEINRFLLCGLVLFFILSKIYKISLKNLSLIFFSILFFILMILQTPLANMFYQYFPGAAFLQHPFRLLGFITPVSIFVFLKLAQILIDSKKLYPGISYGLVTLCLVLTAEFFSIKVLQLKVPWIDGKHIHEKVTELPGIGSFQEYLPKGVDSKALPSNLPLISTQSCNLPESLPKSFLGKTLNLEIVNSKVCEIAIRQFKNPILKINLENAFLIPSAPYKDIRIQLNPGKSRIEIQSRTLFEILLLFLKNGFNLKDI